MRKYRSNRSTNERNFDLTLLMSLYSVRLVARLFLDHLLDLEHFLEWFLASLEAASLDMLPVWLLMLDIYWGSLVRYRKRGRRLAEYLLEKLRLVRRYMRGILFVLYNQYLIASHLGSGYGPARTSATNY